MIATKLFLFNPNDEKKLKNLMDNYKNYPYMIIGKNENEEDVWIGIFQNRIETQTFQHNNWVRHNIYYRDGTREELYVK